MRNPIDTFATAMLGELTPTGRNWARAGTVVLAVGAAMSFMYGWAVSPLHALALAGVTFIAAFAPEAAYKAFDKRQWFLGIVGSVARNGRFIAKPSRNCSKANPLSATRIRKQYPIAVWIHSSD